MVILVGTKFHLSQRYALATRKANGTLGYFRKACCWRLCVPSFLYSALVRPHLEYYVLFWAPQHKRDMPILERVQQRMTRMIKGLKHLTYEGRLKELGVFSLKQWTLTGYLVNVSKHLKEGGREDMSRLFPVVPSDMIRCKGHKLKYSRFHMNISKHFCFEGDRMLAQVAQRNCENSICGNIQNPYGHGPGQLTLDSPTWVGWVIVYSLPSTVLKAKSS